MVQGDVSCLVIFFQHQETRLRRDASDQFQMDSRFAAEVVEDLIQQDMEEEFIPAILTEIAKENNKNGTKETRQMVKKAFLVKGTFVANTRG